MQVGVAYSENNQQFWMTIEVPEDACVEEVIGRSGVLDLFPHLDLLAQKVGIFGRLVKLDAAVKPGDRVEIYRPITADPATVPRRDLPEDE